MSKKQKDGWIEKEIKVTLNEIIRCNGIEDFDDLITERAGYVCLSGIGYEIIGLKGKSTLIIKVTGEIVRL
jgi:hypothetical protein